MEKQSGMAFGFRKTATAVITPDRQIIQRTRLCIILCFFAKKKRKNSASLALI